MEIWHMATTITSIPKADMANILYKNMEIARDDCERFYFDGGYGSDAIINGHNWSGLRDELAVYYIAWNWTKLDDKWGFGDYFSAERSEKAWRDIITQHSHLLGREVFFQYLRDNRGWDDFLQNRDQVIADIRSQLCTEKFVKEEANNSTVFSVKLLFNMVNELDSSEATLGRLTDTFQQYYTKTNWDLAKNWNALNFFDRMDNELYSDHFLPQVKAACFKRTENQASFGLQVWYGKDPANWGLQSYFHLQTLRTGKKLDNYKVDS
mmetsp:Transcript_37701/g.42706  ORF Transcript_37701/g.42706 Transcript_37701/m.42706 type:complete len:266 (+) Transcript_37701:80-877(+)|eukprot:CAMPEP_0115012442 /NCGR_PEP_ID=MMETSP0216-20121206/24737_1 /TAXON_ID=223996 /ORGANISM="Protocruzia adherens, Strain Boccale" /LENGTH=265 /DNA_ID=CAMNT_0002381495 /DNA_START=57 /DNA_END=854 /DNA_ORIENTATION=-